MGKRLFRAASLGLLWVLGAHSALAGVWVLRQLTNPGGSAIDVSGSDSVGNSPNNTSISEWSLDDMPKQLHELGVNGYHLERAVLKPDQSEIIGCYRESDGIRWIVYNFDRMQKESKVTKLTAAPGFEIVDAAYVNGRVALLSRKGDSEFNCYVASDDVKDWSKVFETKNGDLSALEGFPYARAGAAAVQIGAKLLPDHKSDSWWDLFGGHGASAMGGFDPDSGIVAMKTGEKDGQIEISRISAQGTSLAPIQVDESLGVQQIAVVGGITYVVQGSDKILAFDQDGHQIARVYGTALLEV